MSNSFQSMHILAPNKANIETFSVTPLLTPFADDVLAFLQALSQYLLKNARCKTHPELVALGYWLRASHLKTLQANYQSSNVNHSQIVTKALGTVVHFTPANVDTMFVYSWVMSLLMGNRNVIRVASSESTIKTLLLESLNQLFSDKFKQIGAANLFVSYDKSSNSSQLLSMQADARVIWGGDETVNGIRALPCKPRCRDISFADRYSACVINGNELNSSEKAKQLSELLWRDTKPYAQQACSSPRVIYWLGDTKWQQELFKQVNLLAKQESADITSANNHLVVSQLLQSSGQSAQSLIMDAICVIPVQNIQSTQLDWHLGGGLFLLQSITDIDVIADFATDKLQTLSYWQCDKNALLKLVSNPSIQGIDRIVPVGQALDFNMNWDGYNLFSSLSRQIYMG